MILLCEKQILHNKLLHTVCCERKESNKYYKYRGQ